MSKKIHCVYILILSVSFAALSAWRAFLDNQPVSFCVNNFIGIWLTGACLAAVMLLLYKMKVCITAKISVRKAWIDTLHVASDLVLIAIWGSVYNQLVYTIDDDPISTRIYWLTATAVIVLVTTVMFVYYRCREDVF